MPAYRSKLVSFPGDENVDPNNNNGMDIGQPTPLKMREERPDYHTSTADSALRGGALPRTVPALVPQQQQTYRAADPYSGQSIKAARGILVDSPKHVSNPNRGPMSPIGAADTYGRSATPPPAGRTSRAASSSMTPRRRRNKDKRQEAEQNLAFYDDSFVEEFVLCAKEEMSAKERAAKKADTTTINDDTTTTTGRSSSKANSILRKEKERLRSNKHHSSSKRHHDRKSHRKDEEMSSGDVSGDVSANDDSIGSDDDDSIEMRSNTSRRSDKRHHKHHHHSSKKHQHHRDAEEEIDPEEEYQALEHARRSASRKVAVPTTTTSKGKRARSMDADSDIDQRSIDMGGDSYTSSSSEDFTDTKGVQRHRRHRRHHHSRSRNTSPNRATTTTTTTAASSILLNPVDMKPAPRRRGARRESVVAFADSHPLVNDKPIRAGRSPSLRSNDGDAPVVLGRQQRGGKQAVSEDPQELLGRLQSVERPVLLGRSRRAADLMQQEVAHRTNVITAASAVPVPRQRGGKAAAARKAATTTTTATTQDIFEGLDDDDASTPLRQQPSHHAHVLQAASRHGTAAKTAGIKSNDPMAVFFESAFPTPSRFDEMASMASAPPVGRRKNNGNFPLMLPTTIAKGTKRRA